MTLAKQIQSDYLTAFKNKDIDTKNALALFKAEIEKEQKIANTVLSDEQVINIALKSAKRLRESIKIYQDNNRPESAQKEMNELNVLEKYLPTKMSKEKLNEIVLIEFEAFKAETNISKRNGQLTGVINKKYKGQFEMVDLHDIINNL